MFKSPRSAGVVILNHKLQLLLLLRSKKSIWMPRKWGLPGGVVEMGEHWTDAAIRETKEETTLDVKDLRMLSINDKVVIYITDNWSGTVQLDHEHEDFAWVGRSTLKEFDTVPLIKELYELAIMYGKSKKRK